MEIEWLGHASFRITSKDKIIYIDPYSGDYKNAPKADLILITHHHYDHFATELIEKLRMDTTEIVGPSLVMKEISGSSVKEGSSVNIKGLKISVFAAYNVDKPNHPKGEGVGYVLEIEGKKIYHSGDTDLIPEMNAVEADIALLPIGGTYTMDAQEAASAAIILSPEIVIPMHWGSIVGHEEDALHFKEQVEKDSDIQVKILKVGEKLKL